MRGIRDWPQRVRVEWDRGRVDVAASIELPSRGRLDSNPGRVGKKEKALVERLLITISQALELLLVQRLPPEQADVYWSQLEQELLIQSQQARRRGKLILTIVILFVLLAVGAMVFAIVNSTPGAPVSGGAHLSLRCLKRAADLNPRWLANPLGGFGGMLSEASAG